MQVGDNIEDFAGVTQEDADLESLLPQLNKTLFLLPNPDIKATVISHF